MVQVKVITSYTDNKRKGIRRTKNRRIIAGVNVLRHKLFMVQIKIKLDLFRKIQFNKSIVSCLSGLKFELWFDDKEI